MEVTPSSVPPGPGINGQTPASGPKKVKDHRRSRVTNGSALLPGIDGRSPTAKRYKDLVCIIVADQGGADMLSEARMQLIRRFAAAACLAEQMEARVVAGEKIDLEEHAKLSSTLVRIVNHLGLERVPRDVTPYVGEVIDGHLTISPQPESTTSLRNRMSTAEDVDAA
jgi:hypothetical protein